MMNDLLGEESYNPEEPKSPTIEAKAYDAGFKAGKSAKLEEILEFQVREQINLILCQVNLYHSFAETVQNNLSLFGSFNQQK